MPNSSTVALGVLGAAASAGFLYFFLTSKPSSARHVTRGLSGLYNLGNTCYANALIQGLSSIPSLVNWLRRLHCDGDETRFLKELKKLVLDLDAVNDETLSAHDVSEALRSHGWNIGHGVEQDLHELFNVFSTTWEEELGWTIERRMSTGLLDVREMSEQTRSREVLAMERCSAAVRLQSGLRAPIQGILAERIKCAVPECTYKRIKHEACSVIPVKITKTMQGMRQLRVETLLRDHFRMEVIRGATCDDCKARCGRTDSGLLKQAGFAKLPPALIIRIERLGWLPSGACYKIDDHVDFAETLDVRDFCFYRSKQADYEKSAAESRTPERTSRIVGGAAGNAARAAFGDGPAAPSLAGALPFRTHATIDGGSFIAENVAAARYRYQLRAVSEHKGLAESGHYLTYRRGLGANSHVWYLTNDSQVTRVPYLKVAGAQAYMLYYERMRVPRQ
ncbi:hypothetical protein PENTCL1PPCAC_10396 [Pristionchus entomophagus]|uniref:Ubiquitin carboxyl-terminal hydrolase n=1 Tax=Pristionchus entomophagus TaxID=358040 RepID=A0AAV5T9A1_9BILA|nr:hypothetical protein PENTCL1PPCAC_10396 [Pristionchus entomophagus]